MGSETPLLPLWYDNSRSENDDALSEIPRDRLTRDLNAGGPLFHTRNDSDVQAYVSDTFEDVGNERIIMECDSDEDLNKSDTFNNQLVRKRVHGQNGTHTKRRALEVDNSCLTSDNYPHHFVSNSSKISLHMSSESISYFHQKVPSSPPAFDDFNRGLNSSPQREEFLSNSQATVIAQSNDDIDDGSDTTIEFNVNFYNRIHGYLSSDYVNEEQTYTQKLGNEELLVAARNLIAKSIEDGVPKLHLDNLGLRSIPDDIEDLKNLVVVGRYGIEIPKIEIYAVHNKLKILPPSLFNVNNIAVLSLRNNNLKKVPGNIIKLQRLTDFSVVSNQIKVLPYQILKLPNLVNLLVRPNSNLIELHDHDKGSYFCVGDDDPNHQVDKRRYVSKIKWIDFPLQTSTQLPKPLPIEDVEAVKSVSSVPKLSEFALRAISRYDVSRSETKIWKKNVSIYTQRMIAKALQKGIYGETCSVCDQICVNPVAKALEWWDFKSQRLIPVRRNFCCGICVKTWLREVYEAKRKYEVQAQVKGTSFNENDQ
ncbi:hypothetical protein WICMUC_003649 [Wickerhamomyces mucosus]|uniref:Uncharacterized protein n=1 Tax=Wickerhamomyces mucosus TaxID=1378264 RepID=A0A9P8PLF4_9ASCO|nr:hypothetical protein WICMUC_003649 [Wickerhamomyces mucosus]